MEHVNTPVVNRSDCYYTILSRILVLGLVLMTLTGCLRANSDTVINEDGGWTKTVEIILPTSMEMPGAEQPDLNDFIEFVGDGWDIEVTTTEDEQKLTAVKSFAAGANAEFVLTPGGNAMARSVGSVTDGTFVETWKWVGESQEGELDKLVDGFSEVFAEEKIEMAAEAQKTVATNVGKAMWKEMFGPNDPLISMFMHSSKMEREYKIRFYNIVVAEMTKAGVAKSEGVAKKLVLRMPMEDASGVESPDPASGPTGENDTMVEVNVRVRAVGKTLASSNGQANPVDDTVEWSFYPEACAFEDLVMRASYR